MKKIRWQERRSIFNKINELRQSGLNDTEVCEQLNSMGFRTHKGNEFKQHTVHQYVYTCKKAGMRETKTATTKQLPLVSTQTKPQYKVTAPETVSFESALTSDIDGEKLTIMKTIIESKLPTNKKFEAIVAVLK